ncbi:MAG TPA: hypothetical protein VJ579_00275 [Candidatus Paceibacterota bacterium]|nr:hypothetical protein [Candidatus Paceibacterota bacterium]
MKSITITLPTLSRPAMIILSFALASLICFIIGWWRGRDFKITGYPIPLPNHFKGCGSYLLGWVLAIIAVALALGRLMK